MKKKCFKIFLFNVLMFLILSSCNIIQVSFPSFQNSIQNVSKIWLSRQGGEEIFIEGDFTNRLSLNVRIDNNPCNNLKIHSDKLLSCSTPANKSIKNVELKVLNGQQVSAKYDLKYVGVLGQPSVNYVIQKARGLTRPVLLKNLQSKLYIGDSGNKRIVGFNDSSVVGDFDFDLVIGLSNIFGRSDQVSLEFGQFHAYDLDYADGLAMIADPLNHRVLIYDGIPSGLKKPKIVLGQPDALSNTLNNGLISAKSLNRPKSAKFIDGKIFIADSDNNRILVWNAIPTSNFTPADFILGQVDFNSNAANRGGSINGNTLHEPIFIEKIGNKLFVTDSINRRILIWNSIPSSNVSADSVLGQVDMTSIDYTASDTILEGPGPFKYHQGVFYLADTDGHRLLVYKNFDINLPIPSGRAANVVLGQNDFTTVDIWTPGVEINAQTLTFPYGVEIINNRLFIGSLSDNRVLVYNHLPTDENNDQNIPADLVIGQPSLNVKKFNRTTPGPQYLPEPSNVATHDGKLFINSETYGRISVWNSIPDVDFAPADFVLGQKSFFGVDINISPIISATTLDVPFQMLSHEGKFIVSDLYNNRILIWNEIKGVNGQAADIVLGQADMTTRAVSPVTSTSLNFTAGMEIVDSRLVVNDRSNNRILIFNTVPSAGAAAADYVLGQVDFFSNNANGGSSISANTFFAPNNSVKWLGRFVVSDQGNRRVLFWNSFEDFLDKKPAAQVWGQDDFLSLDVLQLGINRIGSEGTLRVINNDLYFTDPYNNRIIIFSNPSEDFYFKPTSVMGQNDFETNKKFANAPMSAEKFDLPIGIFEIDNYNFIAESANNRVLIIPK